MTTRRPGNWNTGLLSACAVLFASHASFVQTIINVPPNPAPFVARDGEIVNLLPGGFLSGFRTLNGSRLNILGGVVGRIFDTQSGSVVTMSDGYVESGWTVGGGATVHIDGGLIDDISAFEGAMIDVAGGAFGGIASSPNAHVALHGFDFMLDGVPISGLDTVGAQILFNTPGGSVLSGVSADGTPFSRRTTCQARQGGRRQLQHVGRVA
jgi:hypothetical protein